MFLLIYFFSKKHLQRTLTWLLLFWLWWVAHRPLLIPFAMCSHAEREDGKCGCVEINCLEWTPWKEKTRGNRRAYFCHRAGEGITQTNNILNPFPLPKNNTGTGTVGRLRYVIGRRWCIVNSLREILLTGTLHPSIDLFAYRTCFISTRACTGPLCTHAEEEQIMQEFCKGLFFAKPDNYLTDRAFF